MTGPLVSVVVVGFNGATYLRETLPAVEDQSLPRHDYEVIYVDNASADDSVDYVKLSFPDVEVQALTRNIGYYQAFEHAAKDANGEYVAVLPQDMVPHRDWLRELMRPASSDRSVAVCASNILGPGTRAYGERLRDGSVSEFTRPTLSRFGQVRLIHGDAPITDQFTLATTGPQLFRSSFRNELGYFFDPRFSHYGGDWEASLRAAVLGYSAVWVPSSVVYHVGEEEKRSFDWRLLIRYAAGARDQLLVFYKVMVPAEFWLSLPLLCLGLPLKALELRGSRKGRLALAIVAALLCLPTTIAAAVRIPAFSAARAELLAKRKVRGWWVLRRLVTSSSQAVWHDGGV